MANYRIECITFLDLLKECRDFSLLDYNIYSYNSLNEFGLQFKSKNFNFFYTVYMTGDNLLTDYQCKYYLIYNKKNIEVISFQELINHIKCVVDYNDYYFDKFINLYIETSSKYENLKSFI